MNYRARVVIASLMSWLVSCITRHALALSSLRQCQQASSVLSTGDTKAVQLSGGLPAVRLRFRIDATF